jgi:integrase/recombinase XerD
MKCHYKDLLADVDDKTMQEALRQFEFHIRTKNLTPKTISVYGERLGYFQRYLRDNRIPFENVNKLTIQSYILFQKQRGLADISVNGQIRVLRVFFKFLRNEELISNDPMEKIQLLKTEKRMKSVLSEKEIEKLLAVPDKRTFAGLRNFCMLLVFYDTLIRLTELINIKFSDIDVNTGMIRVLGKGRKERHVPIGAKTAKYLYKFMCMHRKRVDSDHVFCTTSGRIQDQRNVQRILERIGQRVGIHVSPHLIRHSAASHRAMQGMPAFLLQRLLGHSTIQMTEKYVHLVDNEKLKVALRQYSPLDLLSV